SGLSNLYSEYIATKARRLDLEVRIHELEQLYLHPKDLSQSAIAALNDPVITSLRQQHAELQGKYAQITQEFRENHPKYIAIKGEIGQSESEIQKRIQQSLRGVKTELDAIVAKEKALVNDVNNNKRNTLNITDNDFTKFMFLKSEVENKRT